MRHVALGRVASRWLAPVAVNLVFASLAFASNAAKLDVDAIADASGAKVTVGADGVVRIGWIRTDVPVSIGRTYLPAAAGLGSWAAFIPAAQGAMVMGDTVVFEDEVDAAMDAAFSHGLLVTGLHNHFFYDTPKVFYMHVAGEGDARVLAGDVRAVWDAIKAVRKARPQPAQDAEPAVLSGTMDVPAIEQAIGEKAAVSDGVATVTIGVDGAMHGTKVGASAGLTTWAAFFGSDASAAVDGDVIMRADQVQPTLRALRKAGLHVVALHNHMVGESPPFYFAHFWGTGKAIELATGFRQVLEATRTAAGYHP